MSGRHQPPTWASILRLLTEMARGDGGASAQRLALDQLRDMAAAADRATALEDAAQRVLAIPAMREAWGFVQRNADMVPPETIAAAALLGLCGTPLPADTSPAQAPPGQQAGQAEPSDCHTCGGYDGQCGQC